MAFFDTHAGLIPCKVLSIKETKPLGADSPLTFRHAEIELTGSAGPYQKGEVLEVGAFQVVERKHIRRTQYNTYLTGHV